MAQAAVEDADQPVGQSSQGLLVGLASRRLRASRATTTRRLPEARVIGAVPA
jgi:hypothetical protein